MRGIVLAALALIGAGLVAYSFLKPGAEEEAAAPAETAAMDDAAMAAADAAPSEPAPTTTGPTTAPPAARELPQTPPASPPQSAQQPGPPRTASLTPPPAVVRPRATGAPPPSSAPGEGEARMRSAEAASTPAPAPPPAADMEEAAPVAEAASVDGPPPPAQQAQTDDAVIMECARTGAWGIGGCPTQEDLITRFSRDGSVAFTDPPTEMNLGKKYTIRAAASLGETLAEEAVRTEAGAGANIQTRNVQLLPSIEAELTGTGFDIRPLQREGAQALLTGRANEWAWEVTPTESGERRLTLIVWGQLTLDGAQVQPIRVQTVHHEVAITVDWPTRATQAVDWVADHWEAGAGLGALGLAGFGWAAGRRRRKMAG